MTSATIPLVAAKILVTFSTYQDSEVYLARALFRAPFEPWATSTRFKSNIVSASYFLLTGEALRPYCMILQFFFLLKRLSLFDSQNSADLVLFCSVEMGGQDTFDFPPKSDPVELTATAVRNLCLL